MAPTAPLRFRKGTRFSGWKAGPEACTAFEKMDLQEAETGSEGRRSGFSGLFLFYNGSGAVGIRAEREVAKDGIEGLFSGKSPGCPGFSGGTDSAYLLYEAVEHGAQVRPYFVKNRISACL